VRNIVRPKVTPKCTEANIVITRLRVKVPMRLIMAL
jgi:hypothetical protein